MLVVDAWLLIHCVCASCGIRTYLNRKGVTDDVVHPFVCDLCSSNPDRPRNSYERFGQHPFAKRGRVTTVTYRKKAWATISFNQRLDVFFVCIRFSLHHRGHCIQNARVVTKAGILAMREGIIYAIAYVYVTYKHA